MEKFMKEEYSHFKLVHHQKIIEDLKQVKQVVPIQVQIVPSNVCNQKCLFCAYRMKEYLSNETFDERQILSFDKIIEILDDCKEMGVKAVQYTGGGEPLIHLRIKDIFKHTFQNKLELALVSNGMSLDEELCDLLGDASWIRISVDSSTPELYGFIRNVPQKTFNKVIKNIETLVKYKRKSIIGIGFVMEKENWSQVFEAAKIAKNLGVNNFRISAVFTPMKYEYFKNFFEEAKDLSEKAEELSDNNFTVFNLFGDRVKDTFENTQNYNFCPIKELLTYIGADYNVYTCCTLAYNQKGLIGSIKDQSFMKLWNSDEKQNMFKNHNPIKVCQHPCMYKNKNEFINYCIEQNPTHVNFI